MFHNHPTPPQKKDVVVIDENIIIIDGDRYKKDHEGKELEIIDKLVSILGKLIPNERNKPIFTLYTITNKQINLMANVALVIGSPKTGLFTLIDNKTLLPITPVTYSNQALGANSNPEFATFALAQTDPNDPASLNAVVGTPVAPGSGTLVITTTAAYADPGDGSAQSGPFSITKAFTVVASADGASFDVVFP